VTDRVLWYLHDHGRGHLERARAVIPRLAAEVVVAAGPGVAGAATDALGERVVALPTDVPMPCRPTVGPWHHAPSSPITTARALALTAVVEEHRCTTAVVDVSVEVTVLARLLGLRVITLRQSGRRDDVAHRIGLATADAVWVPQHRELEPIGHDVDERWAFTGPFSRYDGIGRPARPAEPPAGGERLVVLLVGAGGHGLDPAAWRDVRPPPGWRVVIAGTTERFTGPGVEAVGHREPILPLLAAADVVVTSAGWAAVADVVAAGARLVVVPEPRPFDEQLVRACALSTAGLAVCCPQWPAPDGLAAILGAALALRPERWASYHDGHGADRAAALVDGVHGR
jgi:UDP-N-acetylglucosamine--N-acetylmuramyl-(pentapeptide) pyrophosphoryl-undecaprenol N-acetylglucosamine transferase